MRPPDSDRLSPAGDGSRDGRRRRVLVVEDDIELRDALSDFLQSAGHVVDSAGDGETALERMRSSPPDAMILDLMLPVMNGWQVLAEQRLDPNLSSIPVVVVSGNTSAAAAATHAEVYLVKPIDAKTITQALDTVLSTAELRREPARVAHSDRLAAVGLLAAGIAHEITNPLTYVVLELEKARAMAGSIDDPAIATQLGLAMERALDGTDRIKIIVHDVATFTRADPEERQLVDLFEAAQTAVRMVRHRIEGRARLHWDEGSAPPVLGSEGRLVQVILNLLINATDAVPEGDAQLNSIRVAIGTDHDGWAFVDIADTGEGIPRHLAGRIFEPFFTTRAAQQGTGLGLALCKDIVTSLDGEIVVSSEEGKGATFRVRLPPARR